MSESSNMKKEKTTSLLDWANAQPRSEENIKQILEQVQRTWLKAPHLRLGQLLGNCAKSETQLYYLEDEVLLEKMKDMYKEIQDS